MIVVPTPSFDLTTIEEPNMLCSCAITAFPGPIPDGMVRVSADIPRTMFEQMEAASRRRGVHLDHLILAALSFAAAA